MKEFWNDRYRQPDFAYGEVPNAFFREQLDALPPGSLLLPADGEGRNGVYAATRGWNVFSSDLSREAGKKAMQLAMRRGVSLDYKVGDFGVLEYPEGYYDAAALIYAHFSPGQKRTYHERVSDMLKPGGWIILEAFSKDHLKFNTKNPAVGGPRNVDMLLSVQEVQSFFPGYTLAMLEEAEIDLQEGAYHRGRASVIRFVGRKPGHQKP